MARSNDDRREFLRKVLKDKEGVKIMFDKFRQRSKIKGDIAAIVESKAEENSVLRDLSTYVKHMQHDLGTMIDILEATTLNSIEFRQKVKRLLLQNVELHEMKDDDLKNVLSLIEQVDKDVKEFKEHKDILKWIDDYVKSQTNGDSKEDGR